MKLTKKLLPALGMLALSACMLVTSTFAWFAMNDSVQAKGMSVTAKGDQVYLQIVTGADKASFTNGAAQTEATASLATSEILPVNVVNKINDGETSCTAYAGDGTLVWVTNVGTSNTVGAANGTYKDVTSTATTKQDDGTYKYYLYNTFSIRLDPTAGAATATKPLDVASIATSESADAFKDCLNVLVVSTVKNTEDDTVVSTMGQIWACTGNTFTQASGVEALSATDGKFSADTYAVVDVYVFFNGDDEDCTQAKLALSSNTGYDVTVNFTVA